MSGFFGIFRPQGGSVDLDAFEQMRKATEREGFDGLDTHVEEKIAMGHLMLRVSPEAKYDQQPLRSECRRYLLVGHFRLDYRDELGDKLGLTQSELELTPDSQLVMLAYQKWKDQCVNHIEGDWAFALFDSSSNSLMLAKDRTGYSALFYTVYQEAIYFSSDVNVIGALETIPFEVDMVQFYRLSLPSILVEKGKTLLKEVYHLNGGTYIICMKDAQIRALRYWQKTDNIKIRYHDDQDYAEQMRSVFARAIKSRLRTEKKTGIFLSAGLDSMAVAYFSAAELLNQDKKLYSFTSYPYHLDKIDEKYHKVINEVPLVQMFVEQAGNVEPSYLNFPNATMSDYFDSDLTKDLYNPIISTNTFWIQGIINDAKLKNVKRLLNGQIGNMTISFNAPLIQADRIFSCQLKNLRKEFKIFLKLKSFKKNRAFKNYFIIPVFLVFRSFFKSKKLFKIDHLSRSILLKSTLSSYRFIKQEFKEDSYVPDYYFFKSTRKFQIDQLNRYIDFAGMNWYKDLHLLGIEGIDPTSDSRLVDFILSIPIEQFNQHAQQKLIYRSMMAGKLNEEILFNPFSMRQSHDIFFRISSENNFSATFNFFRESTKILYPQGISDLISLYNEVISDPNPLTKTREISIILRNLSLLYCIFKNNRYKFTLD